MKQKQEKPCLQTLSTEDMEKRILKQHNVIKVTAAIYAVIILLWIILGYWRTNLPIFISTLALGTALLLGLTSTNASYKKELLRRKSEG